eukprot:maker-scaffold_1-snap-gene-1.33-mRNA-1 protein AED:0.23 eAED:0.23 QI:42/1/1/1/0.33/0.25/4/60/310
MKEIILKDTKAPEGSSSELQNGSQQLVHEGQTSTDIEAQLSSGKKKFMEEFFNQVKIVQQCIEYLKISTRQIKELREKSEQAIGTEEEKKCSDELQEIISKTSVQCTKTKEILKKMKEETDLLIKSGKSKQSELRIRRNLLATHSQKFIKTLKEYQNVQNEYKQSTKNKLIRRVKIVKSDATEEEIQKVLEMGDVNAVYQALILENDTSINQVADTYKQAADKYQDVIKLERNVVELRQMFVDVALLVEQQGEMLNKIEYSVNHAEEYIEKGNKELVRANKVRRKIRKKYFILALIGAVLLLVILGPILS